VDFSRPCLEDGPAQRFFEEGRINGPTYEYPGVIIRIRDQNGRNQLEGELRRWEARKTGVTDPERITDIELTMDIVRQYCDEFNLPGMEDKFGCRLQL
jgi:hypothetical protein